jgi:hypothetical protein
LSHVKFDEFQKATESLLRYLDQMECKEILSWSLDDKGDYHQLEAHYKTGSNKKRARVRIKKQGQQLPSDTLVELKAETNNV